MPGSGAPGQDPSGWQVRTVLAVSSAGAAASTYYVVPEADTDRFQLNHCRSNPA